MESPGPERNEGAAGLESPPATPSPNPAREAETAIPPPEEAPPRRRLIRRGPLRKDAHDRLAIFAVRAIFFFVAAGLGVYGVQVLSEVTSRSDLDPILGMIIACGTALVLIVLEMLFTKAPIRTVAAITFGLIIGLVLSLVFQSLLEFIVMTAVRDVRVSPKLESLLSFLRLVTTALFSYYGVTFLLQTKDDFKFIIPYVEFRREVKGHVPLVFDTSSFVDGRIEAILGTALFDQRLIVPRFVVGELQTIADSSDRSLRERGRRGLDILNRIERSHHVEILDEERRAGEEVDKALISLAGAIGGKIVTTDYNLQKSAKLQGVPVLNINDLATALKPAFVPGENMRVKLLREGDDRGQAVGFLRDGTMVVVENARNRIGDEVSIEVTSSLQTNAGKMVFGKLRKPGRGGAEE
jgi:uncharacterized protein YacL